MNTTLNNMLLRCEGLVILLLALGTYFYGSFSWPFFVVVFLGVDIVLLLYAISPRGGARCYAVTHNFTLPAMMFMISLFVSWPLGYAIALALIARTAFDRMFASLHIFPFFPSVFSNTKNRVDRQIPTIPLSQESPHHIYSIEEYARMKGRT